MSARMDALSEAVFKKSFADCGVDELKQVTAQYPYFAPAHFMLLKKFSPDSEEYRQQYQKAILFYHDPISFEYFLNREVSELPAKEVEIIEEKTAFESAPREEPVTKEAAEEIQSISTATVTDSAVTPAETETAEPELKMPSIAPVSEPVGDLSFEPYHSVDYFASQGIKLSQEEVGKDKFGKQLKSFTDWLKTMKRLPANQQVNVDPSAEKSVTSLADHSVKEADILTESMAEVWLKQGNKPRAIEVYRKLSLLNPSKSAYFAAKIDHLNSL